MKRFSFTLLALTFALLMSAEPIGKQTALYTAQAYMLAKGKNINATQTPFKAPRKGATQTNEEAYYYVFNAGNDGGYVIVSGDDRTEPILGYVEEGSFDPNNIPENMRSWLQLYADQIKFIVDNDIQPNSPLIKKRNKVTATKHSVGELLKSRWNQGHPYNLTCPNYYTDKDNNVHQYPASGCVATAMAQVMYFYKYPAKTKAIIPAHSNTYTLKDGTVKEVKLKAIPRNTVIDWEYMHDTYSCNDEHVHDRPDTAVANLLLYCGQAVKMGYGASSGAATSRSRDVYVNYFGFDSRAYWGGRGSYSIDEWFDMLYHEIEEGYPVLYAGHSSGGGHAFVLDGFDGDNLFHVNWGWGGGSNGWFLVSILNPGDNSGIGASSSSDGYSMSQGALFNLRTPDTPKGDTYLSISEVSVVSGTSIKAKFTNKTGSTGSFHTGVVMLNEEGSLSLVGTRLTVSGIANDASVTKTFTLKNKLPEGTYKLSPASKSTKSEVWHPEYNLRNQYIEAVVDSTGAVDLHFPYPTYEDLRIDTITFPGTRIAGTEQEVKVTFRNYGAEYFKTIYLLASKTQTKVYTESKSMVAVRPGETVDVSYFFKPTETGTYNLWLSTDDKGNNVMGQGTIDIVTEAEAVKAKLAVSSYTISNGSGEIAYGKRLVGKAVIKNNATTDFHGSIKLQLWSQKVGASTAYSGPSRSFSLDIPAGKTNFVEFEFDNLNEGYYYRIKAMYVNQDGTLTSGGIWDHKWEMLGGILNWKTDGTLTGKAYSTSMSILSTTCGIYADCNKKINRVTPNNNPNTIYAFASGMVVPNSIQESNVVSGNHTNHINLESNHPYVIPVSFDADSASFTYTFPETEAGTGWHAFTMPFEADSIFIDDMPISLEDSLNHFWIYEFSAESNSNEVVFKHATQLRGGTPYIIAGDAKMAGRSIVFRATNVPFYKTGTDKMLVTSPSYKFHGNTYAPKLKDCYILNEEGTAFEYTTKLTALKSMVPYFTTSLSTEEMPDSIALPEVPVSPGRNITLDETSSEAFAYGIYDQLTLKRTFEAGWNTVCLPFAVDSVAAFFGEGSKAYEVLGLVEGELDCCPVDSLAASQPYIIYIPEVITEDFLLSDINIYPDDVTGGNTSVYGISLQGTYVPIAENNWIKREETDMIYVLNADGTIVAAEEETSINGFRAYFDLPAGTETIALHLYDSPDAITSPLRESAKVGAIYNLAGQRLNKLSKGINIINGKKVLK